MRHIPSSICRFPTFLVLLLVGFATPVATAQQDVTGHIPLKTRWANEVDADSPLPEYPRPQLRRDNWVNLNGKWDYAIRPREADAPQDYDGKIVVPFAVESLLSGVEKPVGAANLLWYRRSFEAPSGKQGRVLLHFGAVDWKTRVWVNGQHVGEHQGGYDPFTFDITESLRDGENELVVSVWDPTDEGYQPRGKQIRNPHGIWYTPVTGIWQTVWLERVPASYVESLKITPSAAQGEVTIAAKIAGAASGKVTYVVREGDKSVATAEAAGGEAVTIAIPEAKLWNPDSPHLYDLVVETDSGDRVESYFGLRDIKVAKDAKGVNRFLLNGEPLFHYGPLDQGWWPDGLYTAPTDEALKYDIEMTKQLGFNMIRKHVKVEPARWYYWCDKMGILVWQDMPSGEKYIGRNDPDITRSEESGRNFEAEYEAMIRALYNHPSIVMWVPYNEGWGQWETERIAKLTKEWDPTRLVNSASGWTDRGVGDMHDVHIYPGPGMPPLEEGRAAVLGEFGGLGLALKGHTWQDEKNWGYRSYKTEEELVAAYRQLLMQLRLLVHEGLAAAVYTQTTDVEIEVNGLMTYDREVLKFPKEIRQLHEALYGPPPEVETLVPTSQEAPQEWRYTFQNPGDEWMKPDFDDSQWKQGPAGFGAHDPPGVRPRTRWDGTDIWIRREVTLPAGGATSPVLNIYHDEDATVYLNGKQVAKLTGYSTSYELVPLRPEDTQLFAAGKLVIAVHCKQTGGGQFIDLGIIDVVEPMPAEPAKRAADTLQLPKQWQYSAPLIAPEPRDTNASKSQKDPTIVWHDGRWHCFMTVRLVDGRTIMEYCNFARWEEAGDSPRTLLDLSDSKYYCAPQVFYFAPHEKWYLIYQVGVPGQEMMQVAYSTTTDIANPKSWSRSQPILDGKSGDPRTVGGIDYWIICDDTRAYLFFTSNNGKMWRMSAPLEQFPYGFDDCEVCLEGPIFEASHTYRLKGMDKYLTIIEQDGIRHYKAYVADRLDGDWTPLAATEAAPLAGKVNITPAAGVRAWTDNVSHGELVRDGVDQTLTVDPKRLIFVFQGMLESEKAGKPYGDWAWRIALLTPVDR